MLLSGVDMGHKWVVFVKKMVCLWFFYGHIINNGPNIDHIIGTIWVSNGLIY